MKYKIRHRTQTRNDNCTSACIAMILEKEVEEVTIEFHDLYLNGKLRPDEYLRQNGLIVRPILSVDRTIVFGNVYLFAVPSLNMEATLHSIVADTRNDILEIYDPRKGTGYKYYVYGDYEKDKMAVNLKSYIIDVEIICEK